MKSPALSKFAKCYIALLVALAAMAWASSFSSWRGMSLRLAMFVRMTLLSSRLKVRLTGVIGTLSVNYVFILLSAVSLPAMEVMIVALAGTLTQSLLGTTVRPAPAQVIINVSAVSVCAFLCNHVYNWPALRSLDSSVPVMLFWTSLCYFAFNTGTTAVILAITTQQKVHRVWYENYLWSAPHYLFGALLTSLLYACDRSFGWQYSVLVMPAIYFLYRSYNVYLNKIEEEKRHVTEMASLHLRTIETLALAIEAKDDTTHSHLRRVQIYALELAKEIGLGTDEIRALEAAALLHDIGKLAVPEYILNKPGRLTKEEFEKMKVHPVVGAEILECVQFPYPVAPIVRSHHEKWDGSGYPDGLKAEQIPIGARILSLVDVLDALASDRQYRPALKLEDALPYVTQRGGQEVGPRLGTMLTANIQ